MKYDQEIKREIELEEQDFIDLFKDQEVIDDGTKIYISKIEFLRAVGRLDPAHQLSDDQREKYRTEDVSHIEVTEMEDDLTKEEKNEH